MRPHAPIGRAARRAVDHPADPRPPRRHAPRWYGRARTARRPLSAKVRRRRGRDTWQPDGQTPRAAFARQVAMYLAHVVCGLSLTEVGALFARDRTTVAHACEVVEDRRDDPQLDGRLDQLERAVASLMDALTWRGRRS